MAAPLRVPKSDEGEKSHSPLLRWIHFNDCYSPFDRAPAFIAAARAHKPDIITFGGDLLSPSPLDAKTQGAHMIELLNSWGVAVAVLGNHDFAYGVDVLEKRIAESSATWLCSNLRRKAPDGSIQKRITGTHDNVICEVSGVKVGIFGLVIDLAYEDTLALPMDDVIVAQITALKAAGATMIVAMTHLNTHTDDVFLRKYPEIDLILGGHDHLRHAVHCDGRWMVKAKDEFTEFAVITIDGKEHRVVTVEHVGVSPTVPGNEGECAATRRLIEVYRPPVGDGARYMVPFAIDTAAHNPRQEDCPCLEPLLEPVRRVAELEFGKGGPVHIVLPGGFFRTCTIPEGKLRSSELDTLAPYMNDRLWGVRSESVESFLEECHKIEKEGIGDWRPVISRSSLKGERCIILITDYLKKHLKIKAGYSGRSFRDLFTRAWPLE
jgi:predicted phosphodiesterase